MLLLAVGFGVGAFDWRGEPAHASDATPLSQFSAEDADAFAVIVQAGGDRVEIGDPREHQMEMEAEMGHVSPAQSEELAAQLALATEAVPKFATIEDAAAAGYVEISPVVDGIGSHWTKWSLVDQPFDPQAPSQLLFEEIKAGHGPELVALSYWIRSPEAPEGFVGEEDHWHRHLGMCFIDGWLKVDNRSERSSCEGDWVNGSDLWMLHAWVVPGMENQVGVFHNVNPRLCERYCE